MLQRHLKQACHWRADDAGRGTCDAASAFQQDLAAPGLLDGRFHRLQGLLQRVHIPCVGLDGAVHEQVPNLRMHTAALLVIFRNGQPVWMAAGIFSPGGIFQVQPRSHSAGPLRAKYTHC